jgi:hypothetical protein
VLRQNENKPVFMKLDCVSRIVNETGIDRRAGLWSKMSVIRSGNNARRLAALWRKFLSRIHDSTYRL